MTKTSGISNTKTTTKVPVPKKHKVVFYNDDYTPMLFVIEVLMVIFGHPESTAIDITEKIHKSGIGIAGEYPLEIAEQKAHETIYQARRAQFPLIVKVQE